MLGRLGRWCFINRKATVAAWVVALGVIFSVGAVIGSGFDAGQELPGSETEKGADVLDTYFGGVGTGFRGSIVFEADQGAADPEVEAAMSSMFASVAALPDILAVNSPYGGQGGISTDGRIAFAEVQLDPDIDQESSGEVGDAIAELIPVVDGLRVEIGGADLAGFEPPESEVIGVAFAIVVLIIATGSVLAMGLSVGTALVGVAGGVGSVVIVSHLSGGPSFATVLAVMIGLGAGIDYALFIVNRYRELLRAGETPLDATGHAFDTSGRAVLFAGLTVVISLLGLMAIGLPFVTGLGVAMSTTVTVTIATALTLLPALIGFAQHRVEITRWRGLIAAGLVAVAMLGVGTGFLPLLLALPLAAIVIVASFVAEPLRRNVPRPDPRPLRETFAYRWSRFVQAHPWAIAAFTTLILLVMALPVLGLRLGFSDEGNFSEDTTTRQAYDLLADGFSPGFNGPLLITVEGAATNEEIGRLSDAILADPGVATAPTVVPNDPAEPQAFLFRVVPTTSPQDVETDHLVSRLRSEVIPDAIAGTDLSVAVTGSVAGSIDFSDYLADRIPLFFTAVLLLSFLLLMIVFRSLLVPIKAVIMNLLSIGASYGVVVMVFQWGWLSDVVGIEAAPIEPFLPMMMFAIVFGLSMDYEVFLLTRVKEEYDRTGDAVTSVADGLASTARVITAAAAIMVVVFGSFLLEDDRIVQMFGTGLAAAILLDATLVRMLLVPATMELLGDRNWWMPTWLERHLPRLDIEGGPRPTLDPVIEPG